MDLSDSRLWVSPHHGFPQSTLNAQLAASECGGFVKGSDFWDVASLFGGFKHHLLGPSKVSAPKRGGCFKGNMRTPADDAISQASTERSL